MGQYFLLGEHLNNLGRPNVTLAMTPPATVVSKKLGFKAGNLVDGFVENYAQWSKITGGGGDGGADDRRLLVANLCLLRNGGFEQGLIGWQKAGTVTIVGSPVQSGIKAVQIVADNSGPLLGSHAQQDFLARAGELQKVHVWGRGDGTNATALAFLRDLRTGRYLQPGGASWGDQAAFTTNNLTASYIETALTFQVEPFSATQSHLTTLRLILLGEGSSGNVNFDDCCIYPAFDWCSVHGFNFPAVMAPRVWTSATGAFAGEETLVMSLTPRQPAFYKRVTAPLYSRYLMFELQGFVDTTFLPIIGELVVGQSQTLLQPARFESSVSNEFPVTFSTVKKKQVANTDRKSALKTAVRPTRLYKMGFRYLTQSPYDQAREWFVLRCRAEKEDIVFAPDSMDADEVVYGGLTGLRGHAKVFTTVRDAIDLTIQEDPFPRKF